MEDPGVANAQSSEPLEMQLQVEALAIGDKAI